MEINALYDPASDVYVDDAPKSNPWKEDRLGYAPFAKRLADAIRQMRAPNGYVIGLSGVWGSGKTTAIQFVEAHLQKHNEENPDDVVHVVNFKPWLISGHQDLLSAFFKLLNESMFPAQATQKERRKWWRKNTVKLADPAQKAMATLATVFDPTGIAKTAVESFASASFEKYLAGWAEEPSVQAAYHELQSSLRKMPHRILVIIDDIDRLQRDEIRTIMQLVKSVGQLPNIVYLLSYDREIIWKALEELPSAGTDRPGFAEKIIQHEVELPQPGRQTLLRMLDEEARFVLERIDGDSLRWHHLSQHGIQRWIRHPRNVTRFSNALKFMGPALLGELDPHDLLAMEGLRIFERPVFDWVRANRDFLVGTGRFIGTPDEEKAGIGRQLIQALPETSRDSVLTILCDLFPSGARYLRERRYGGDHHQAVVARRGIGVEHGYDAYFSNFPSEFGVPKTLLDELAARSDDLAWIRSLIATYTRKCDPNGASLITELNQEIEARISINPSLATYRLLEAILAEGESIATMNEPTGFFGFRPSSSWWFVIQRILTVWGPDRADRDLYAMFDSTASVIVWTTVYVRLGRAIGTIPDGDGIIPLVSKDGLERIGGALVSRVEQLLGGKELLELPYYYDLITAWTYIAGSDAPREWVRAHLDQAQFVAKLSAGILSYYLGRGNSRRYSLGDGFERGLLTREELLRAAKLHVNCPDLDADQRLRLEAIVRDLQIAIPDRGRNDETPVSPVAVRP